MNERIKELAKQAYIADASKLQHWKFTSNTEHLLRVLEGFNKEFAELIVKECIGVAVEQKKWVQNQQATFNYDDDLWDRARIQQSDRIIGKIREHFGIEE